MNEQPTTEMAPTAVNESVSTLEQRNAELSAKLAEVEKERDEARRIAEEEQKDADELALKWDEMRSRAETAERELAEARKNRERLDWIENEAGKRWVFGNQFEVKFTCMAKEPFTARPTLRAAIDAASLPSTVTTEESPEQENP